MTILKNFRTVAVLVLSGLFIYLGLVNLVDRINWSAPGDGVEWSQGPGGAVEAVRSFPKGSEIVPGDRLLSINGIPVTGLDDHTELLELLAEDSPEGTSAIYQVERADSRLPVSITVVIGPQRHIDSTDFLLAFVALAFLSVGILVFLPNWQTQGSFHFYLICLVSFILFLYRHSGEAGPFDVTIYWCSAVAFLLLPPLFLHFCCHFPVPLAAEQGGVLAKRLFYLPSAALLFLQVLWFSGGLEEVGLARSARAALLLDRLHLAHFGIFLFLAVAALFYSNRLSASPVHRLQGRWIAWGAAAGTLPFLAVYVLPFLMGWPISAYMEASVLGFVLVPVSFGYAITQRRLTDIRIIFNRGAAYVLATSALLGLYVAIILLIGRAIQDFSPDSGFVLFAVAALLVAFLFAPLKDQVQNQIDRYFYREEYGYRESLFEFGTTLSSEVRLSSLTEKLVGRIRQTFNVDPVAMFLRDDAQRDLYRQAGSGAEGEKEGEALVVSEQLLSELQSLTGFLSPVSSDDVRGQIHRRLAAWNFHYVLPLSVRGGVIGFWALGKKFNGELLSSEDMELLKGFSAYASVAVDNALLYRSLEEKARELAQLKAYSENVVESITLGVSAVNPEGEITVWNSAMEAICGLERSEALGRHISTVFPEEIVRAVQGLTEGPGWLVETTHYIRKTHLETQNAGGRLVNIALAPFILQEDVVTGTLLVFDDVTDKSQLENQLLQAEKLSSLGLLVAGIAHEVNTPITGICSYTQMLLKQIPKGNPRHELLKKIEKQGFRASTIVDNLLNFAQVRDSDFQAVNINSLVLETLSLLEHQFKKTKVDIKVDLEPSLPATWANGGKLQQVFMNLFLNARDAMPQGGRLRIRSYRENSQLIVRIEDSGTGISQENIKRIYDPFFTTKEVGEGVGLGLAVSYGIIQEHSGKIDVESIPGRGTAFQLHLPVKRIN